MTATDQNKNYLSGCHTVDTFREVNYEKESPRIVCNNNPAVFV